MEQLAKNELLFEKNEVRTFLRSARDIEVAPRGGAEDGEEEALVNANAESIKVLMRRWNFAAPRH